MPILRKLACGLGTVGLLSGLIGSSAGRLHAQSVTSASEDAIPIPRHGIRYVLAGVWNDHDHAFTATGTDGVLKRSPLFESLNLENAGVNLLPNLATTQALLRTLTGETGYQMSLGQLSSSGEVRQSIARFGVDYGVTNRISVGLRIPYAESRDVAQLMLNRVGTGANVGLNPARQSSTSSAAIAENSAIANQLAMSLSALSAEIERCSIENATGCEAIQANPGAASALIARTEATRNALAAVYGTSTAKGSLFVPLVGSAAQAGVAGSIASLRSEYARYGITSITEGATPRAASQILGPGGMDRIGTDTAFGVGYERLGNTRRAGLGDIDLTASVLLFDTFKSSQERRLSSSGRAVRWLVSGGWRFGTAGADRTEDAFDVPIGEGANAILLRSTTDLVWSRHMWLSATIRTAMPMSDKMAVVLPFRTLAESFAYPVSVGNASRSLGMRSEIELAPRFSIGDFFGISGTYSMKSWGADKYIVNEPIESSAAEESHRVPARTLHSAGFGVTFSTLASYARGRSRIAAEVMYTHTMPLSASTASRTAAVVIPAIATDRLELRVYTGFPRR